jgi:HEAT repeat protein
MAMTLQQLKMQLGDIEPDESTYLNIGPAEIPLLDHLLEDDEAWIASRAVFALSRMTEPSVTPLLSRAAADPRAEVRIAVAAAAANLKPEYANRLLLQLLADAELGVRKFAIQSVAGSHDPALTDKLKYMEAGDPEPAIREIARDKLQELR